MVLIFCLLPYNVYKAIFISLVIDQGLYSYSASQKTQHCHPFSSLIEVNTSRVLLAIQSSYCRYRFSMVFILIHLFIYLTDQESPSTFGHHAGILGSCDLFPVGQEFPETNIYSPGAKDSDHHAPGRESCSAAWAGRAGYRHSIRRQHAVSLWVLYKLVVLPTSPWTFLCNCNVFLVTVDYNFSMLHLTWMKACYL